ncbi:MAG: hypothetical protein ABIO70_01665 [Pseudomonadota bacterium]
MAGPLLTAPVALRAWIERVSSVGAVRLLSPEQQEALAEAKMRLALHTTTPPAEALALLTEAQRLDSGNPKYPYHLARLCMVAGEPDAAAAWIGRALQLCPTSHRLWCHAALLQQVIFERDRNQSDRLQVKVLRQAAEAILTGVRSGCDDIDPGLLTFVPPPVPGKAEEREPGSVAPSSAPPTPPATRGEGKDDAAPAPGAPGSAEPADTGPRRLQAPGRCRWGGVAEIEAESRFPGEPDGGRLKVLTSSLAEVAELAHRGRRGGAAAFSILAIQALVRGYPPSAIAEARARFTGAPGAALALLDQALALARLGEDKLPPILADHLARGQIPPLLAALLHRRRILWRDALAVPTADYVQARRVLRDPPTEADAFDIARSLDPALKKLDPAPPTPIRMVAKPAAALGDVEAVMREIEALEGYARALAELVKQVADTAQKTMSSRLSALEGGWAVCEASVETIEAVGVSLLEAKKAAHARVQAMNKAAGQLHGLDEALAQAAPAGTAPQSFARRSDACASVIRKLTDSAIKRPGANLRRDFDPIPRPAGAGVGAPWPEAAALLKEAQALSHAIAPNEEKGEDPDLFAPPPVLRLDPLPPVEAPTPELAPVAEAVCKVDEALRVLRQRTLGSLQPYGMPAPDSPIALLGQRERVRFGLLLHRLGRQAQARRIWLEVLQADPLCAAASRNIAVSTTVSEDPQRALAAWQRHATVSLCRALVRGTLTEDAAERVELHRQFAAAYLPAWLTTPLSRSRDLSEEIEPGPLARALTSTARTQEFVEHKLLEFLYELMSRRSPSLVLGLPRDAVRNRDEARDAMLAFAREACAGLPGKLGEALLSLCEARLQEAHEACGGSEGLTSKKVPCYDAELEAHRDWLRRACHLKYKLLATFQARIFQRAVTRVGWAAQIGRLDRIPVGLNPALLLSAVGELSSGGIQEQLNDLGRIGPMILVQFVLEEPPVKVVAAEDRELDARARQASERRLGEAWCHDEAFAPVRELLDAPQRWYPAAFGPALDAFKVAQGQKNGPDAAQTALIAAGARALRAFAERYPFATDAVHLATTLESVLGERDIPRAVAALQQAEGRALTEGAREKCRALRAQLEQAVSMGRLNAAIEAGDLDEVEGILFPMFDDTPGDVRLLNAFAQTCNTAIGMDRQRAPALMKRIARGFDRWLAGATDAKASAESRSMKHQLTLNAASAPIGQPSDVEGWRRLAHAARQAQEVDATNEQAANLQMMAHYNAGVLLFKAKQTDAGRRELVSARDVARRLVGSADQKVQSQARELLKQVEAVL